MNLFEATKLLQSVGYTVKEDPKWEKFDRLVESIVERIPEPEMLNEMSKKVQGAGPAALACLSLINSIDSKRSNFKSGKTKDTSIGDKVYAKYADAWEKLQAEIESQGADGEENYNPGDLKVYNMMIDGGYAEAIANDDINAVKTTNSTHGAKDGLDFNTAIETGNIKRAIQCLKNSYRSGGGERAIESMKGKLAQIWELEGADAYEVELNALENAINNLTAGSRASRNADKYVIEVPAGKEKLVNIALSKAGIAGATADEAGNIEFVATPSKAAAVADMLGKRGIEMTKLDRPAAAPRSEKTSVAVKVDDVDAAEMILDSNSKVTYESDFDTSTVTITGTAAQIEKAIAGLEATGIEVER